MTRTQVESSNQRLLTLHLQNPALVACWLPNWNLQMSGRALACYSSNPSPVTGTTTVHLDLSCSSVSSVTRSFSLSTLVAAAPIPQAIYTSSRPRSEVSKLFVDVEHCEGLVSGSSFVPTEFAIGALGRHNHDSRNSQCRFLGNRGCRIVQKVA